MRYVQNLATISRKLAERAASFFSKYLNWRLYLNLHGGVSCQVISKTLQVQFAKTFTYGWLYYFAFRTWNGDKVEVSACGLLPMNQ